MGEKMLRFVVNEVNKMLHADYNMISFDSLSRNSLLQICADCLNNLDAIPKLDVSKNTDEALTKIMEILINIRIPLPNNTSVSEFTDGIIQGKRNIVHPALYWILSNQSEVKKRAYFSKYLNKVPIPMNIAASPDVQPLLIQYEHLIQEFKTVHAENAKYAKMGAATLELRKDIEKMNTDISKIVEQIDKQKLKINVNNQKSLFVCIKAYRSEVSQQNTLKKQLDEQNTLIEQLDNKIKKLNEQLKSQQSARYAPENLLGKLQEEVKTNRVIVQERMPQELEMLNQKAQLIDMVVKDPPPSDDVITDLQHSIDNISLELEQMVQKHVLSSNARDDKLAEFRQHASVIANNKRIAADRLMELKEKVNTARRQVDDREMELQQTIGGTMPQGDELKRFVSKLRARSVVYKEHRALLLEFQAEVGVLKRTQDILLQQNFSLAEALQNRDNNKQEAETEIIPDTVTDLSKACKDLASQINSYKADTILSRQQLQNLKTDMEELTRNHQKAKEIFDSSISNLNAEINKLETEVNDSEKVIENEETKWKKLKNDIEVKDEILNDINEDTGDIEGDKKKSQKIILTEKINEQESIKKTLETEMQQTMAEKEDREQQVLLWHSTLELLKSKKSLITTD